MKRIVWIFGLLIGVVLSLNMFVMTDMIYSNKNFKGNVIAGYAILVLLFSFIFVGVRNYRNQQLNGSISFGKAFKTGALIAFVGSTLYVIIWLLYYNLFVPDFIDVYTTCVLNSSSPSELPAKRAEMEQFKEMYKHPWFVILITYSEVLPVGMVVAFVSGLILHQKDKSAGTKSQNG